MTTDDNGRNEMNATLSDTQFFPQNKETEPPKITLHPSDSLPDFYPSRVPAITDFERLFGDAETAPVSSSHKRTVPSYQASPTSKLNIVLHDCERDAQKTITWSDRKHATQSHNAWKGIELASPVAVLAEDRPKLSPRDSVSPRTAWYLNLLKEHTPVVSDLPPRRPQRPTPRGVQSQVEKSTRTRKLKATNKFDGFNRSTANVYSALARRVSGSNQQFTNESNGHVVDSEHSGVLYQPPKSTKESSVETNVRQVAFEILSHLGTHGWQRSSAAKRQLYMERLTQFSHAKQERLRQEAEWTLRQLSALRWRASDDALRARLQAIREGKETPSDTSAYGIMHSPRPGGIPQLLSHSTMVGRRPSSHRHRRISKSSSKHTAHRPLTTNSLENGYNHSTIPSMQNSDLQNADTERIKNTAVDTTENTTDVTYATTLPAIEHDHTHQRSNTHRSNAIQSIHETFPHLMDEEIKLCNGRELQEYDSQSHDNSVEQHNTHRRSVQPCVVLAPHVRSTIQGKPKLRNWSPKQRRQWKTHRVSVENNNLQETSGSAVTSPGIFNVSIEGADSLTGPSSDDEDREYDSHFVETLPNNNKGLQSCTSHTSDTLVVATPKTQLHANHAFALFRNNETVSPIVRTATYKQASKSSNKEPIRSHVSHRLSQQKTDLPYATSSIQMKQTNISSHSQVQGNAIHKKSLSTASESTKKKSQYPFGAPNHDLRVSQTSLLSRYTNNENEGAVAWISSADIKAG